MVLCFHTPLAENYTDGWSQPEVMDGWEVSPWWPLAKRKQIRECPFSLCHRENTMLVFQNRYFSILLSPNSPSSSAILPFLRGSRKTNVSLGKGGVTLGCPDHVGGGEYHVSRRDSMEGREMEGHTSGLFFQAFE